MRGLFVSGTDTGVGKTVVSAALLCRYPQARYWKPVQTGIETDDDTAVALRLSQLGAEASRSDGIRLPQPVSPHLAARRAGIRIDLDSLTEWIHGDDNAWIVEGAGGILTPLNASQTIAHLAVRLALPVVIVARTTLGTINQTLLTMEALRARSLRVAGVVMAGKPDSDNRAAIEHYGKVAILGEMPRFDPLAPRSLAEWARTGLDTEHRLQEFFE